MASHLTRWLLASVVCGLTARDALALEPVVVTVDGVEGLWFSPSDAEYLLHLYEEEALQEDALAKADVLIARLDRLVETASVASRITAQQPCLNTSAHLGVNGSTIVWFALGAVLGGLAIAVGVTQL